jgi:hypothetical protein
MKKILIGASLLFGLSLVGCNAEHETEGIVTSKSLKFEVIRIGKCQYIGRNLGGNNNNAILAHKGDCDNPIHVYNKVETQTKIVPPTP